MAEEDPSAHKRLKLSSPVELPDLLWAKIFSYLPLKERFQLSAVCRQWRDISRIPWSDIKRLDMSDIPSAKINSILSLTSVVSEIIVRKRKIVLDGNSKPPILTRLESVKLYNVCFSMTDSDASNQVLQNRGRLLSEYCDRFPKLSELVWHNASSFDSPGNPVEGVWTFNEDADPPDRALLHFPNALGRFLRRLQLTHSFLTPPGSANLIAALNKLEDLECLHLGSDGRLFSCMLTHSDTFLTSFLRSLENMRNLRELSLRDVHFMLAAECGGWRGPSFTITGLSKIAALACEKLHKLEVLIFTSTSIRDITRTGISRLLTDHPTLKILVVCGASDQVAFREAVDEPQGKAFAPAILPLRRRKHLSSAGQSPLPCLQIFVGGPFLRYVRFTLPESGAAIFTEIDCPMPQFLAKPQVADVFKEVWAAKMIREGAENGGASWDSTYLHRRLYSTNSLQFHNNCF